MKLIAFTRPDGHLLWINPDAVCFATASSDHPGMVCTEIYTAGGKVLVRDQDVNVVARLGDHMTPEFHDV